MRITYARIQRILGPTAFSLWVALLWRRDAQGVTHACNAALVGARLLPRALVQRATPAATALTASQVARGMRRLRAAGLVSDGEHLTRIVEGDYRKGQITVPGPAAAALSRLKLKGGDRRSPRAREGARTGSEMGSRTDQSAQANRSKRAAYNIGESSPSSLREEGPAGTPGSVVSSGESPLPRPPLPSTPAAQPAPASTPPPAATPKGAIPPRGDLLAILGRPRPVQARYQLPRDGVVDPLTGTFAIPPFPDPGRLPGAKLPPMPRLHADQTPAERIRLLVEAWKAAHHRATGRVGWLKDLPSATSAAGKKLLAAAEFLLEQGAPPVAWAAWSFDHWTGKGRAPLGWTYSLTRLQTQASWFSRTQHAPPVRVNVEAQRDLARRWALAEATARRLPSVTIDALRQVGATIYPEGVEELEAAARAAVLEEEAAARRLAARGEWVWW